MSVILGNEQLASFPLIWGSLWWRTGAVCVVLRYERFLDGSLEGDLSMFEGRGSASRKDRVCSDEWAAKKQLQ